jgi:hypothetical protein
MRACLLAGLVAVTASCGGGATVGPDRDAAGDGRAFDASLGVGLDAGWTQCTSPGELAVCGGPYHCPTHSATCPIGCGIPMVSPMGSAGDSGTSDAALNVCLNDELLDAGFNGLSFLDACRDGMILVQYSGNGGSTWGCSPFDLGVLFAKNGGSGQVRYADFGLFTGAPLPGPESCPDASGFTICGGNCGPCPETSEVCTGRSPLHPNGFCVPQDSEYLCEADAGCDPSQGMACLSFTVQPDAQAVADKNGLCLPASLCQAVAAGLPGGASCSL